MELLKAGEQLLCFLGYAGAEMLKAFAIALGQRKSHQHQYKQYHHNISFNRLPLHKNE